MAPADGDEAYLWAARVLDLAWRFQLPGILLVDKTLCEGGYSCSFDPAAEIVPPPAPPGDVPRDPYLRYRVTESGVSPMLPMGTPGAVVKINSYEHDEAGITIEDGATTVAMQDKRMRKGVALAAALAELETVAVYGGADARIGVVSWGSTVGAVREAAADLPVRVVQPVVLEPFPAEAFRKAVDGLDRIVVVEENLTGQLEQLDAPERLSGRRAGPPLRRPAVHGRGDGGPARGGGLNGVRRTSSLRPPTPGAPAAATSGSSTPSRT